MKSSSTTANAIAIFIVSSAISPRAEINTLATSIYAAGAQVDVVLSATSYISTTTAPVTRAVDNFEKVLKSFPNISDMLGGGITSSHICHPLAGAETAAMPRLQVEAPAGLKHWSGELILIF